MNRTPIPRAVSLRIDLEQAVDLTRGQRRGGLVEDQQPGVREERPGDLDHLHLGDAELLHGRVGRHLEADLLEQLERAVAQLPTVYETTVGRQVLEGEVLFDGQIGEQVELLVHDPDAQSQRLLRSMGAIGLTIEEHLAGVGLLDP